jgi:hypothetical protein
MSEPAINSELSIPRIASPPVAGYDFEAIANRLAFEVE